MKVVGLTGGIGSGKSTVSRLLRGLGAHVIDADVLAREVVEPGTPGLREIVERFGPEVLDAEGRLDRPKVGRRVFADEEARKALNAIVHPRVSELAARRIRESAARGAPLVVYDVPLLYENGLDQMFPEVIVVWVDPEVQRSRIAARDGLPPDEIEARIRAQMPLDHKAARATHVIDNNGDEAATRRQVASLFDRLTAPEEEQ